MNKKITAVFIALLITVISCITVYGDTAGGTIPDHRLLPRAVDEAGLLSAKELDELNDKLDEMSERLRFDIAVATVSSTDGKSMRSFSDDYYDYNGYGIGDNADGIMLVVLLNATQRECYITGCGYGENVLTDRVLDSMLDDVTPYLSSGDYAEAFDTFADLSEKYLTKTRNSESDPEDDSHYYAFDPTLLLFGAFIGIIVSFIIVGSMRRKLKSLRSAYSADNYIKKDSLDIRESRDWFLYSHVTKSRIENDSSSSGGGNSTSHTSSSGRSHSGGGRSF